MDQTFDKRKKVILDFISDDLYVPMKIKEIAAVLQIPREQRGELKEVLDALVDEGKISLSKRGKYSKGAAVRPKGYIPGQCKRIRVCDAGRRYGGCVYPGRKYIRGLSGR